MSNLIRNYEPDSPELCSTQSYYQFIVSITKCDNLSLGIRFQSNNMIGYIFGLNYRNVGARPHDELFKNKKNYIF